MRKILAVLDRYINCLEVDGQHVEADHLNTAFVRLAEIGDDATSEPETSYVDLESGYDAGNVASLEEYQANQRKKNDQYSRMIPVLTEFHQALVHWGDLDEAAVLKQVADSLRAMLYE